MINPFDNQTGYWVNPEDGEEMTRLIDLDDVLTKAMGGLFPPHYDLPPRSFVLDVACGPGVWGCHVAENHRDSDIIGLDISKKMLGYARAHAQARQLSNISFDEGDIFQGFPYPDGSIDYENVRLISSFTPEDSWKRFLDECIRILRPGGRLRLTEAEWNMTNKRANERFAELVALAMQREGKSFSGLAEGKRFIGATIKLGGFFRQRRFTEISEASYFIDMSAGSESHEISTKSLAALYPRMAPFLLRTGVASQEEIEHLSQEIADEFLEPDFEGGYFVRSVWGKKPQE